ncbi:hypothetical protein Cthiooxydans_31500 [Comamonas thiooxydans]|nr:hypothetical protein Cthiooxydans_31500 [Comamonas thiooxydans]
MRESLGSKWSTGLKVESFEAQAVAWYDFLNARFWPVAANDKGLLTTHSSPLDPRAAVIQSDRYRVISLAVLRAVRMTPMSVADAGPVHSP